MDIAPGLVGDDGRSQLVVVAADVHEYPTCIAIVDPRTGDVGRACWHQGTIGQAKVVDDFLPNRRSAIVAYGVNNKLDGYDDGLRADETRYTCLDFAPILLILDPVQMGGIGPPFTSRIEGLVAQPPYAYGYMDLPHVQEVLCPGGCKVPEQHGTPKFRTVEQMASFQSIKSVAGENAEDGETWIEIEVTAPEGKEATTRAFLTFDRNLELKRVLPVGTESAGKTLDYWQKLWHPIVRAGQYVDERSPKAGSASPSPTNHPSSPTQDQQ